MNSQDRDREVRKILFAIFQEMKPDDVMAASFFIRSKSNMNCSNKFELMHELENLSFFDVSKLNFDDFIELLSDIDRIDLAKKLESQVAKLQTMTLEDMEACKFFIRSESTKECNNIYDLMHILENLAYFTVSNKPQFRKLIELLGYINRFDLQKKLKFHAEKHCDNDKKSTVTSPLNLDEQESKTPEENNHTCESSMETGDNDNEFTISSLSLDEQESKTPEVNNATCESSMERGDNDKKSTVTSPLNLDEQESKTPEENNHTCESSMETGDNDNEFTISSLSLDEQESKTPEVNNATCESSMERDQHTEDPSVTVTSEDTFKINTKSDDLLDFATNSSISDECNSHGSQNSEDSSHSVIKLYNYQKELAAKAKNGMNCIICSPTGSGKTITAGSVIDHHLKEAKKKNNQSYRVLYLVHIRFLVKHLAIDLKKILDDDVHSLEDNDLLFSEHIKKKAVVILTAQILDNALNFGHVKLSDYDLLVFDECHNTVEKHPYNEIMKKYHELKRSATKVPQILGLSATVGRGQDPFKTIVALCANMWTPSVCCVCDENNLKELQEKNQAPIIDKTIPCKARGSENFHKCISRVMEKYIIDLESKHKIEFGDTYQIGTQEFESFLSQNKSYCEKKNIRDGVKIFEFLIIMNKSLIYYNELTAFSATEYLCENLPVPSLSDSKIEENIHADYTRIVKDLKKGEALEDKMEENDKLLQLKSLMTDIFKENPETKVIILCQTRFNVIQLTRLIKEDFELKKFIKADLLIGQTKLTQKEQEKVLKRFGNHELNVLISTSIAEQGLNVPDCEIVIRYLYVTSDISRRQAHGRARKKDSKCYLIAEENTDHIYRDFRNKQREKEMDDALTTVMTLGEEKFSEEVLKKIKILDEAAEFKKYHDRSNKYKIQSEDVQIFCKECHQELCLGSDIIKKGTDYICIDPDFESKVIHVSTTKQVFRYDSNVALSRCNGYGCKNQFGAFKMYNSGNRSTGYVLSVKSILFQINGHPEKIQLKKWSQHFFPINEESLT